MKISLPDVSDGWGYINILAECGPMSEGGILSIEDLLSPETIDAIIRDAGDAMIEHYRRTWYGVGQREAEIRERTRAENRAIRQRRLERIGGGTVQCTVCGATENITIDHIIPRSRNGTDAKVNLQLLCSTCNASKGARTMEEWLGEAAPS